MGLQADAFVADEGAVLFDRAFGEANGEAVDELLLQLFVRGAHFSERLHAVAGRNEAFVLRHGEQGGEGFSHLAVWVAFGEIAKDLGSDGAAAIVFVRGMENFQGGAREFVHAKQCSANSGL